MFIMCASLTLNHSRFPLLNSEYYSAEGYICWKEKTCSKESTFTRKENMPKAIFPRPTSEPIEKSARSCALQHIWSSLLFECQIHGKHLHFYRITFQCVCLFALLHIGFLDFKNFNGIEKKTIHKFIHSITKSKSSTSNTTLQTHTNEQKWNM